MGEPNWIDRVPLERTTSRQNASAAKVTALLFCAEEDEAALHGVGRSLAADGLLPRIVPGAELDLRILDDTLEMMVGPTLATIVVSEHLDRYQAHRLAETFCIRRSPLHRLLVLELQPGRPQSLLRSMRRASQALTNTLRIDERGKAKLTASARTGAASGQRETPLSSVEPISMRVYRAPVVVEDRLQDRVGVIPAHVRVPANITHSRPLPEEVTAAPAPEKAAATTRPDMRVAALELDTSQPASAPPPAPTPIARSGGYSLRLKVLWGVTAVLATLTALGLGLSRGDDGPSEEHPAGVIETEDGVLLSLGPAAVSASESIDRCQSRSALQGEPWALPTPEQLSAMVSKGTLGSAAYWTRPQPRSVMVVQWRPPGLEPPAPASDGTQKAGSVCVRYRPGGAQQG